MTLVNVIDAGQAWLASTILLAARLGALFLMTPPLGARAVSGSARMTFVVAMSALLAAALPSASQATINGVGELVIALLSEFALGATLALGISFAFAAFAVAARLLDVQIGFGIGQVFDPVSQQQLPVVSGIVGQLAVVLFFVADVHLAVLRGIALSIERFPPRSGWSLEIALEPLIRQSAAMFSLGFATVAPVVFCLALVDLGLGVLARSLPQMNMFVIGIPLKVVAGLAALSLWIVASGGIVARIHASIFAGWDAMFR